MVTAHRGVMVNLKSPFSVRMVAPHSTQAGPFFTVCFLVFFIV
jgi:hypothetical protein